MIVASRRLCKDVAGWLGALVAFVCATAGHAEEANDVGPEVRLAGTIGILIGLPDRVEDSPDYETSPLAGVSLDADPSIGFNAELGYRMLPWFSVAVHVEHLAEISVGPGDSNRGSPQSGSEVLSGESWALTADARVYPWQNERLKPFAVAGVGWLLVDTNNEPVVQTSTGEDPMLEPIDSGIGSPNGFVARVGGGVDIHLTESFFLTTQATYVVPVDDVEDFDYVSVAWGFGYRF